MKQKVNKFRFSKNVVSKLTKTKEEQLLGGARPTKKCPTIFNGCPLQTNEQDTNGNYYC